MSICRLVLAMTLSLFAFLDATAQEAPRPPPENPGPAEPEQASPPQPDGSEPRTLEQIFIPSEEIAADEEITFPINI